MLVALLALAASACVSVSTYKTARPLGRRAKEVMVAPQVTGAGPPGTDKTVLPELAIGVRYGVGSESDLLATGTVLPAGDLVTSWSFELGGKRRLWQSGSGRFEVATGLAGGYRRVTSSGAAYEAIHAAVPAILGINLSASQIVISPLAGWQRVYSAGARPIDIPFAGASLGIDLAMTDAIHLIPEITWAASPTDGPESDTIRMIHGGVAVFYHHD